MGCSKAALPSGNEVQEELKTVALLFQSEPSQKLPQQQQLIVWSEQFFLFEFDYSRLLRLKYAHNPLEEANVLLVVGVPFYEVRRDLVHCVHDGRVRMDEQYTSTAKEELSFPI